MHRHGYKGAKFGRERDARKALLKGLAESLILNESIETTLPKAKELRPYTEKLITKAKKGSLADRREIIKSLSTLEAAHKLVDSIAPMLSSRDSGYLRIKRTTIRRGDGTQLARISFVDDLSVERKAKSPEPKAKTTTVKAVAKPEVKKPATKKAVTKKAPAKKPAAKKTTTSKKEAK